MGVMEACGIGTDVVVPLISPIPIYWGSKKVDPAFNFPQFSIYLHNPPFG